MDARISTITQEYEQYAGALQYVTHHALRPGERVSPLILRELYGEHVACEPQGTYVPNPGAREIVTALSEGVGVAAFARHMGWYSPFKDADADDPYIDERESSRRIAAALDHYYPEMFAIPKRKRLAAIKEAIAIGDIPILQPATPNQHVLRSLPIVSLTALNFLEHKDSDVTRYPAFKNKTAVERRANRDYKVLGAVNAAHAVRRIRELGIFRIAGTPRVPRAVMEEAGFIFPKINT